MIVRIMNGMIPEKIQHNNLHFFRREEEEYLKGVSRKVGGHYICIQFLR